MLDRIFRVGIGFAVEISMARKWGPETYGIWTSSLAFVSLFTAFYSLGLDGISVRHLIRQRDSSPEIVGTVLGLKFWGATAVALIIFCIGFFPSILGKATGWIPFIISLGFIFQATDAFDYWFQSEVSSRFTVWSKGSAFLLISAAKLIGLSAGAPLRFFAFLSMMEIAVGAIFLTVFFRRRYSLFNQIRFSKKWAVDLLLESWPLILASLGVMLYTRGDQVLLKHEKGSAAAAIYAVAAQLSEVSFFLPVALVSSVFPSIIRSHGTEVHDKRLQLLFDFLIVAGYGVIAGTWIAAPWILHVFYGSAYQAALPIVHVYAWTILFVYVGVAQTAWNINEGLIRLACAYTLGGAAMNIILNLALISSAGALGAAWARLFSYVFCGFLCNYFHPKTRPMFFIIARAFFPFVRLLDRKS